jgi:hypothetical protein
MKKQERIEKTVQALQKINVRRSLKIQRSIYQQNSLLDLIKESFTRPTRLMGRCARYLNIQSVDYEIKAILKSLNVDFIDGNDAPRGGGRGDFIALDRKSHTKLCNAIIKLNQKAKD